MSYLIVLFKANNNIKSQLLEPYASQNSACCDMAQCPSPLQGHADLHQLLQHPHSCHGLGFSRPRVSSGFLISTGLESGIFSLTFIT